MKSSTAKEPVVRTAVRQPSAAYCEESLRRLRLESLSMFYQHRADPNTPAEVAATIADLIKGR